MRREMERIRGEEGNGRNRPPFANSWIRPWLLGDRPQTPYRGFAPRSHWGLPSARSRRFVPFYTIPDPPLVNLLHCEILLHAHGETHPNYHSLKALGFGISWHSGVIWRHPMSDIICHVICTKYCTVLISLSEWHQCRQNCCQHKPYFTLKMHQIQCRLGLRPRPRWGTLGLLVAFKGSYV